MINRRTLLQAGRAMGAPVLVRPFGLFPAIAGLCLLAWLTLGVLELTNGIGLVPLAMGIWSHRAARRRVQAH